MEAERDIHGVDGTPDRRLELRRSEPRREHAQRQDRGHREEHLQRIRLPEPRLPRHPRFPAERAAARRVPHRVLQRLQPHQPALRAQRRRLLPDALVVPDDAVAVFVGTGAT